MRTAIDEKGIARHIAAVVTAKKDSYRADILQRVADPAHGIGVGYRGGIVRAVRSKTAVGFAGRPSTDDVATDLVAGPLPRSGARQAAQSFLGCVVVGAVHVRVDPIERTEIDHPAASEPAELGYRRLHGPECGHDCHVEGTPQLLVSLLFQPGQRRPFP